MTPPSESTSGLVELEKTTPDRIERMIDVTLRVYGKPNEIAAIRSALGDAAAICDMCAKDIENANRARSGRVINAAQEMAHQVRSAGDRIWRMREQITLSRRATKASVP